MLITRQVINIFTLFNNFFIRKSSFLRYISKGRFDGIYPEHIHFVQCKLCRRAQQPKTAIERSQSQIY
jgi:hypothetical protein